MPVNLLICFALSSTLSTIYIVLRYYEIIHGITNIVFYDTHLCTHFPKNVRWSLDIISISIVWSIIFYVNWFTINWPKVCLYLQIFLSFWTFYDFIFSVFSFFLFFLNFRSSNLSTREVSLFWKGIIYSNLYHTPNDTLLSFYIFFKHLVYSIHSDLERCCLTAQVMSGTGAQRVATSAAALLRGTLCVKQIAILCVTCIHQAFVTGTKRT